MSNEDDTNVTAETVDDSDLIEVITEGLDEDGNEVVDDTVFGIDRRRRVTFVSSDSQVAWSKLEGVRCQTGEGESHGVACHPRHKPDDMNVIIGQSHFIKTLEDVHEALAGASPTLRFGVAFCEASGPCLVRRSGNDKDLVDLATSNALSVGAGHSFFVFLREGYPINVLNQLNQVPEVCGIYCATANPVEVIVAESELGRGILGVIDGLPPVGVETESDVVDRKQLLRTIGYKL